MSDMFGSRMKEYEYVNRTKLLRRTPVIIRLDGKAFHTFTKNFQDKTPYSETIHNIMVITMKSLLGQIQNAAFAYTQSDEISILLNDWGSLYTSQWFDGNIQKIVSVAASITTATFNRQCHYDSERLLQINQDAFFDARAFNIPKEEVANYFVWRQADQIRNSVNMLGQYHFSHKQLQGKNVSAVQKMCSARGDDWDDRASWMRLGSAASNYLNFNVAELLVAKCPDFREDRAVIEYHLKNKAERETNDTS